MIRALLSVFLTLLLFTACGGDDNHKTPNATEDQTTVQEQLITVAEGGTVTLEPRTYHFTGELSLSGKKNVTVAGTAGSTVLDFSGQTSGANGISADNADGVVFQDFKLVNSKGDGIRVENTTGVTFRNVDVVWDGGSETSNGAYALYPVRSSKILIEGCEIAGASDAGIYVGQSSDAIVRNNEVHGNVAGIEIENTTNAEVSGNHCTDNAGGILVFNLPDLPVKDGKNCLVRDNTVIANNHVNFAKAGNIVASVPSGTGIIVLAADNIEITGNEIKDNISAGVAIAAFSTIEAITGGMQNDPTFDTFPETISVHDNTISNNGTDPQGALHDFGGADVVWDGVSDPAKDHTTRDLDICATSNGTSATFLRLNLGGLDTSTDFAVVDCTHPPVPPVTL